HNYRSCQPGRFRFINAAVANITGPLEMWRFKEAELPHLPLVARQIASTEASHLKKHFPDLKPEQIECITIKSLTFGSVLQEAGLDHADLVTVDAEGHELPILESICQQPRKPSALLFESTHFQGESWRSTKSLLETAGYELSPLPADCFAVLKS
ncbi:MAG: Methyltransferase FkbM family, partial [Verrucomicrobia bacterium]|nr:Methyltransferase FkbM family [Verrucomicrobiota bacterium]